MTVEWCASCWLAALFSFFVTIGLLGYLYSTYYYGKWKSLGVPHVDCPTPLFGHLTDVIMGRMPLVEVVHSYYKQFNGHRYFGIYEARKPSLVIRDPELVHDILIGNFVHFHDRNANNVSFKHDKFFDHLVNLRGERWKAIRTKLTPTFTAAKLKSMMSDLNGCSERLIDNINKQITNNDGKFIIIDHKV